MKSRSTRRRAAPSPIQAAPAAHSPPPPDGSVLPASRRSTRHAPPPLVDLPWRRVDALVNLMLRTLVPVVGVLFFGQDVQRLATLYFVDTLLALTVIFGLLGVHFMNEHSSPESLSQRIGNYVSGWFLGALLASFFMVVAGLPMLFFAMKWNILFADQTFLNLLAAHVAASIIAFVRQANALPRDDAAALRLRHRFELAFVRWVAAFFVWLMAASALGRVWPTIPAYVLVLVYSAFTLYAELLPERTRRMMFGGNAARQRR